MSTVENIKGKLAELLPILASILGIPVERVGSLLVHENPAVYHCKPEIITEALRSLSDEDTKVQVLAIPEGYKVQIMQHDITANRTYEALHVRITSNTSPETSVSLGKMRPEGIATTASNLVIRVRELLESGKGLKDVAWGVLRSLDFRGLPETLENFRLYVLGGIMDLVLPMQVWLLIETAAAPFEEEWTKNQNAAVIERFKADQQQRRKLAWVRAQIECPSCSTRYISTETSCERCGAPRIAYPGETMPEGF